MRRDARANREALLDAARRLYAEQGTGVPYSTIASEAGVGIATLYRHFPTVDDLAIGLLEQLRDRATAICTAALERMRDDPQAGWSQFATDLVALEFGALIPQLTQDRLIEEMPTVVTEIRDAVLHQAGRVLQLAKDEGLLRADIDPLHFQAGLGSLTRPMPRTITEQVPDLREWLIEVYLAGVRP